jgi:hypothetical protein
MGFNLAFKGLIENNNKKNRVPLQFEQIVSVKSQTCFWQQYCVAA